MKKDGIRVLTLKIKSSTITNSKYDASQYGFYLLGELEVRRKLFLVREDLDGVTSGLPVISGQ